MSGRDTSAAERFVFTVAVGRCGQASLADLLNMHVPGCHAALEAPDFEPSLPAPLDRFEVLFRRRFIETHELLGRGKVLAAFESGDHDFIDDIVAKRMQMIRRDLRRHGARVYFDVSKFFARGLHVGFIKAVDRYALVNLVRDPVRNMRSFLNRTKNFGLDNNPPEARSNLLPMDASDWEPGEFYVWSWCEMFLRYETMRQSPAVTHAIVIRTEDLEDPVEMSRALQSLGLEHSELKPLAPRNTNRQRGLPDSMVSAADILLFEKFLNRLPSAVCDRIPYLRDYDPWSIHRIDRASAS